MKQRVHFRRQSEYDNVFPNAGRFLHTSSSVTSDNYTSSDVCSISSSGNDTIKRVKFADVDSGDQGDPPTLPLKKKFGELK